VTINKLNKHVNSFIVLSAIKHKVSFVYKGKKRIDFKATKHSSVLWLSVIHMLNLLVTALQLELSFSSCHACTK